jgi:toxin YoeB
MASRKVKWSPTAQRKLIAILEYFTERNKSNTYSIKLYKSFHKELSVITKNPDIGIRTDIDGVRGLIINNYTLFYEAKEKYIIVHTLWDNRQDPEELKIR